MKNIKNYALVALLALGLSACGNSSAPANNASTDKAAEETKTGTAEAEGYSGTIKVTVTMKGDKIESIERESTDTDNIGEVAMDELTDTMIKENSAEVESVTGATTSSEAFKTAVQEAIKNAK